jgi:hypothetical protein
MTHPQTFFSSKCVYFEILNVNEHYIGMEPNSEAFEGPTKIFILKILQAHPSSKSNGRPLNQNFIWLYSLSVQRGRIEYEGETSE